MQIGKLSNTSFSGYLNISGYEYSKNSEKKPVLRPVIKFLDTNSIKYIREMGKEVIINYSDGGFDCNTLHLPYDRTYGGVDRDRDLAYYNLVVNAYNAAASNPNITVDIPKIAYIA